MKRIVDARSVTQSGADAIGFNFYEPSPRFVELEIANELSQFIDDANRQLETKIKKIGVFVNASIASLVETANRCRLDGVQLHGDETATIVTELRERLAELPHSCFIARAIRGNPKKVLSDMGNTANEIDIWTRAGVDLLLLDAAVPGEFGGTGQVLDWNSVANLCPDIPLTLAGGLTAENVAESIFVSNVKSVDVASGVESEPGIKDHDKIMKFVAAARAQLS